MDHKSKTAARLSLVAAATASVAVFTGCGVSEAAPKESLAQRGYSINAEGGCKAAARGDVQALRLLAQAGHAQRSLVIDGERFCLEGALVARGGAKMDAAAVINEVKPAKAELNRAYASSTGMTARDVPQADALARAAGHRAIDLYAGGAVVEATPLMLAVWSGNQDAVQAMLAHGADPNVRSVVPVKAVTEQTQGVVRISASPLFEAQRLQHAGIAKLLGQHGGKSVVASAKPGA
jgi:Ankyrin repeat